jgi:uncharacterized protein YacL
MPAFDLTSSLLVMIAAAILSVLFSYVPGLNTWFATMDGTFKRLAMLLLLAITAGVIYGLGCAGVLSSGITCDQPGLTKLVYMFVLAVVANQSTFTITPPTKAVRKAKKQ